MSTARYTYVTRENRAVQLVGPLPPLVLAGMLLDPGDGYFYTLAGVVWSQLGGLVVTLAQPDEAPPAVPRLTVRDMEDRGWKRA